MDDASLYARMYLIRRAEEWVIEQYAAQNAAYREKREPEHTIKCPTHLSIGQEAAAVGVCAPLTAQDVVFSTHRCHAHYLAKGGNLFRMVSELLGRATGCVKGKGGSMHLVDPTVGMMGASAIVGGSLPLATGAALAFQKRKEPHVAVAFFGDGAVEEGVFHECLHAAGLWKLPIIFACENNLYATLSHLEARQVTPIHARANTYGVRGVQVDGNDVRAVEAATREALSRARTGGGPTLIESLTYRWYAHVGTEPDTGSARRSREELELWKSRCPVERFRREIGSGDGGSAVEAIEARVRTELALAVTAAKQAPPTSLDELLRDI